MTETHAILGLVVYILARELVFWYQTDKMTNKLMSRNFHEYQVAQSVGKPQEEKLKTDTDIPEDLNYLGGFR